MKWVRRGLVVLVALALVVVVTPNAWMLATEGRIVSRAADAPQREVAIVLGFSIKANGEPAPPLEDRLQVALELWQAGRVRQILVSGGPDEDAIMARWLLARGVPGDVILRDGAGVRTRASMENAARRFGIRGAIICTQRYHLPRALAWGRHLGMDVVGMAADRREYRRMLRAHSREILARVLAMWEMATPE